MIRELFEKVVSALRDFEEGVRLTLEAQDEVVRLQSRLVEVADARDRAQSERDDLEEWLEEVQDRLGERSDLLAEAVAGRRDLWTVGQAEDWARRADDELKEPWERPTELATLRKFFKGVAATVTARRDCRPESLLDLVRTVVNKHRELRKIRDRFMHNMDAWTEWSDESLETPEEAAIRLLRSLESEKSALQERLRARTSLLRDLVDKVALHQSRVDDIKAELAKG